VYRGKVEIDATTEMLRKVGRIASENQIQLLLFDVREADYRNYFVETIKHTKDGPSLGDQGNISHRYSWGERRADAPIH
jgi:hypothetical protein